MRTCISVERYTKLGLAVEPTWIALVHRLLKAVERPDPNNPSVLKRWSQGDLAQVAGIRPNTLSSLLKGESTPSLDSIEGLAKAFSVPVFYLLMTEQQAAAFERGLEATQTGVNAAQVKDMILSALTPRVDVAVAQIMEGLKGTPVVAAPEPAPVDKPVHAKKKRTA